MPAKPWGILKKLTEKKFGLNVYFKLLRFIKKKKPYLWNNQFRDFLKKNLVAILIKNLEKKGYNKILLENNFRMPFNHTTFQYNAKVFRKIFMK